MALINLILAVLFGISALFHAFALQWPSISVAESPETHLLFVLVNLWFCDEIASTDRLTNHSRVIRFYAAFVALTLHQSVVHGYLLYQDIAAHQFPVQNLIVLVGIAVTWVMLRIKR